MSTNTETQTDPLGWLKWLLVIALVSAGVYGNSYFAEEPFLYRVIGLIVIMGMALGVAALTIQGKAAIDLATEARKEIKKVVWPTRQETLQTTGIVFIVVVLMSLMMFFLDWILNLAISALVG